MLKNRARLLLRSRRHLMVGLTAAMAAAGLATSPLAASAAPHPATHWTSQADAKPGTPAAGSTTKTPAAAAGPHKAHVAKAAPATAGSGAKTGGTAGKVTPQLADGADPGTGGKDGDGSVANEYDLPMTYKGGEDSAGIVTGAPKVYLVLWGSQWGTPSTTSTGDITTSNDPTGAAAYQQDFFKGLGSAGDGWSAVLTQYCEGIQAGSMKCPANAAHIQYPTPGSVLAGVWVDNAAPSPDAATEPQLGAEALAAAQHFGNTTEAQNRNVQYIIDSPQGANPDKWKDLGYCAWHDFQRTSFGSIAYTNMPYLPDVAGCGANWFGENTTRAKNDGYGIIGGHEYAETLTDPNTPGGWTDATGQEIADKCAWIPMGSNGGLFTENLSTGSFPLQTLWSNTDHLCQSSDPIVTGPALTTSVMCDRTDPANSPVNIGVTAADSAGSAVSYSATGLPNGLTINAKSGVISGTNSGTNGWQRITVTATDAGGRTASSGWWESIGGGAAGCTSGPEQLIDTGFENGSADVDHTVMTDAWSPSGYNVITPSSTYTAHTGQWYAWLGQDGSASDDSISAGLNTYPGYHSANFSFWLDTESTNTSGGSPDTLQLVAYSQYDGHELGVVKSWSSAGAQAGWQQQSVDVTPFIQQVGWGTTIELKLVSHESSTNPGTAFLIDDASAHEN
ncbi:putative Ig domain-containing protein [Kitasatospora sp. NPDC006697]|uniref:putative Ig domain-containing protein n=1 Tax=Kitasatospora sp. NPDC006697 TaxID=3364020 RepID=UPI003684295A